jgi:AcrR family transcriptional regulator
MQTREPETFSGCKLFLCQPTSRKSPRENHAPTRSGTASAFLEVAKEAFTRSGSNASLDDIAKEAGVGAGTLYRHFPTRDALIEAVYRTEVEKMAAAEKKFSESLPPIEALRAWMLLFVDYIATKQIWFCQLDLAPFDRLIWPHPNLSY